IKNVLNILKRVRAESLVIMDELGSGTDPQEGMGIAISILEELRKSGALFLVTTHLTGASCPNSVEQTRNPGRTTGTNTAKGALHRHLSPSRIESNGYWHLSAICSIQRAFATTAAWPPEILLIN
ncbi:MutS-related protein, partial [Alistipes putredinis]|uniref:MutS-related protein n=1 Tax=Alistipes putredinis TaxID=28117 RepID=UPI003AB41678